MPILVIRNLLQFGCMFLNIYLFACIVYRPVYNAYTGLYTQGVQIFI